MSDDLRRFIDPTPADPLATEQGDSLASKPLPPITPERWRTKFSWDVGDLEVLTTEQAAAIPPGPPPLPARRSDADQERFDRERFRLSGEFIKQHHRGPDIDEMLEICRQAGENTGIPRPEPLPLLPDEDGELL